MRVFTLADAIAVHGKEPLDYLDRDMLVPLISRACAQGDISVLRITTKAAETPIPRDGVVLLSGQGGHTHSLHGPGQFDFVTSRTDSLVIGILTVPEEAELPVLLHHDEHGDFQIAPGTYRVGRQREFAGEWRAVAD
jgi:hypothetical protein